MRSWKLLVFGTIVATALSGCVVIQQPAPEQSAPELSAPQEPAVREESGYTANDIAACRGLSDSIDALAAAGSTEATAGAAVMTIATLLNDSANLADDVDIKFVLLSSAGTMAGAHDEAFSTGTLSATTQINAVTAIDSAKTVCEDVR